MINKKIYSPLFWQSPLIANRQTLGNGVDDLSNIYAATVLSASSLPPMMTATASSCLAAHANLGVKP